MTQTVLSIFSGAGGLDRGADGILDVVQAHEIDRDACDVYPAVTGRSGVVCQTDLKACDYTKLPDTNGVIGGPPCQAFSIAGHQEGSQGKTNMWPQTLAIVKQKRPDWFLFENVPALTRGKHKPYFEFILTSLTEYGYRVDWRILNAANYGVPQTRERVFIVGQRIGRDGQVWKWPKQTHFKNGNWGIPRWISWGESLKNWFISGNAEPDKLPRWVLAKYPKRGFFDTFPESGLFNNQQPHHDKQHRLIDEPAFTIVASSHTRIRVMPNRDAIYKLDSYAKCLLQTLPPVIKKSENIGNAVPPMLARAIFQAQFGGVA